MIDFMLIGAQRCGTTWWWQNGRRHPEILMHRDKELHYWDRSYREGVPVTEYLAWTLDKGSRKAGDATPAYAVLDKAVIREIHRRFPDLAILYFIRNPLRRAWSSAMLRAGWLELDVDNLPDEWFVEYFESEGCLLRGDYEYCLRNWLTFYERGQILVLKYDQISDDPRDFLKRTFGHIGLRDVDWYDHDQLNQMWVNYGKGWMKRRKAQQVRESLFKPLLEVYSKRIDRASELLGEDLSHWKTLEEFVSSGTSAARQSAPLHA